MIDENNNNDWLMRLRHQRHQQRFINRCWRIVFGSGRIKRQQQQQWSIIYIFQVSLLIILLYGFFFFHKTHWERIENRKHQQLQLLRGSISSSNNNVIIYNDNMLTKTIHKQWITNTSIPFNYNHIITNNNIMNHLIIVAGHSVTISGHLEDADIDENDWMLLDYQKHVGLPNVIILHIKAGIQTAAHDPKSLLIFSGGQTRANTGPESEASSYYRVADAMQLWTLYHNKDNNDTINNNNASDNTNEETNNITSISSSSVRARTITEEYATDSYENLLFSICRFYEITKQYPTKITMISYTFKEYRFRNLHINAIQYPISQFYYIGIDPDASTGFDLVTATAGEYLNSIQPFELDPYGCHSTTLQKKRIDRNPFFRTPPYIISCPEMKYLLQYCDLELISLDRVPWGNNNSEGE